MLSKAEEIQILKQVATGGEASIRNDFGFVFPFCYKGLTKDSYIYAICKAIIADLDSKE